MDQLLASGFYKECFDNIGIGNVVQLNALPGEAPNVPAESLFQLLAAAPKVPGVARVHIGALEVPHKNLYEVSLVVDVMGQEVL
jgi:hypothetical protein